MKKIVLQPVTPEEMDAPVVRETAATTELIKAAGIRQ